MTTLRGGSHALRRLEAPALGAVIRPPGPARPRFLSERPGRDFRVGM